MAGIIIGNYFETPDMRMRHPITGEFGDDLEIIEAYEEYFNSLQGDLGNGKINSSRIMPQTKSEKPN